MRCLLDTQAFLWLAASDHRLTSGARQVFLDRANELHLSLASVWEIAIKSSLGKLILRTPLSRMIEEQTRVNGIRLLEVGLPHVLLVEGLPFHHRDPFDRLLVAQAIHEDLTVVGSDACFDAYGVRRVW